jgi:lipoate-protein ligase A
MALLNEVARGDRPPTVRILVPEPTLAFGRLDALRPGFRPAAQAAARHGFEPVLRAPGGHAAGYHEGCLLVEETFPDAHAIEGIQDRFRARGRLFAEALRSLGVDARVGEVPGEYCPGPFSVNARGRVKLVGTAQRVVRGGRLFAAVITIEGTERLRDALTEVYRHLGIPMDPGTVGGASGEAAGAGLDAVRQAVTDAYAASHDLVEAGIGPATLEAARGLLERVRT